MTKEIINIVWFKNDIRLHDHLPLKLATTSSEGILLLYCFEPNIYKSANSIRQNNFKYKVLLEFQQYLQSINSNLNLNIVYQDIIDTVNSLSVMFRVANVYSHIEVGGELTFKQDTAFAQYCKEQGINWLQISNNGLMRPLPTDSHVNWGRIYNKYLRSPWFITDVAKVKTIDLSKYNQQNIFSLEQNENFPLKKIRIKQPLLRLSYHKPSLEAIIKRFITTKQLPNQATYTLFDVLFPYLIFGIYSIRQLYYLFVQIGASHQKKEKKLLIATINQCITYAHHIQLFDIHNDMEHTNFAFFVNGIRLRLDQQYWYLLQKAKTGIPIIDAAMICLQKTGFLPNNLLQLLFNFACNYMWLPWKKIETYLFSFCYVMNRAYWCVLLQEEANAMGLLPLKIANIVKCSEKYDPQGEFITRWLPILADLPPALRHQTWQMSILEQELYNCKLGKHYPQPIINIVSARKKVQQQLQKVYKTSIATQEMAALESKCLKTGKINSLTLPK